MNGKPFSQACENNKDAICAVLRRVFADSAEVLEIGSGTGQHAVHFAQHLPWLRWQPSDQSGYLSGVAAWAAEYKGDNLAPAVELDVRAPAWNVTIPDGVFSANTLHIMAWPVVEQLFAYLGQHAPADSRLCVYGPFNYNGDYTSESNARFDVWLAERDPASAIRDFEAVDALAAAAGYRLLDDVAMPANNRLLCWQRGAA